MQTGCHYFELVHDVTDTNWLQTVHAQQTGAKQSEHVCMQNGFWTLMP